MFSLSLKINDNFLTFFLYLKKKKSLSSSNLKYFFFFLGHKVDVPPPNKDELF